MNSAELVAVFRAEVNDIERPHVWSDALLYTYIDEAQKQFCRLTEGIEDSRRFTLRIRPGKSWYDLDPAILRIRSAHDAATGREVPITTTENMSTLQQWFDGVPGPLKALVSGLEKGVLRALPTPSDALTVELRTFRLPDDICVGGEFEIDSQHILNLLYWVKFRAYDIQDSDVRDEKKSEKYRAMFDAYCAKARVEQGRLRRPVATVAYGGI